MTDIASKRSQLLDFQAPAFPNNTDTRAKLSAVSGTAEFQKLISFFDQYPEKSYMLPPFRATMYLFVRTLRPKWAIEIGTLFAGTSEIIASALAANGEGKLTTIDPFGGERVPGIVASWPAELQRTVDYRPVNSMQLFMDIAEKPERPDFVFIDGNHEYEYALFDLLNTARYIQPGGVVILDNYYDQGVRLAGDKFEADNPDWSIVKFSPHRTLGTDHIATHLDELYRVYVAPGSISVGTLPRSFSARLEGDGIKGLELASDKPTPKGTLFYKIYLRTIPFDFHLGVGKMEEMSISGEVAIEPGLRTLSLPLAVPLRTNTPRSSVHRRCEINLLFEGEGGAQLALSSEPKPVEVL